MNAVFFKKLHLEPTDKVLVLNPPAAYVEAMKEQVGVAADTMGKKLNYYEFIHAFAHSQEELINITPVALNCLKNNGILWISYPKVSSGYGSDITRDQGWDILTKSDWGPVGAVSMDEKWSALRFRKLTKQKVQERTRTARMAKTLATKTITRRVQVPPDLLEALEAKPNALKVFEALAYTHRKEYVGWIVEAKREETRLTRVRKAVEMIEAGKKFK